MNDTLRYYTLSELKHSRSMNCDPSGSWSPPTASAPIVRLMNEKSKRQAQKDPTRKNGT